jgi:hypothetical protein
MPGCRAAAEKTEVVAVGRFKLPKALSSRSRAARRRYHLSEKRREAIAAASPWRGTWCCRPCVPVGSIAGFLGRKHGADADADPRGAPAQQEGLAYCFDYAGAEAAYVALILGRRLDDREFVAADARDRIRLPEEELQALAHLLDEEVARRMAESIVDLLEAIEVEHVQRDACAVAPHPAQRLIEPVFQKRPVRKACKLVVHRLVLRRLLAAFELVNQFDERLVEE